MQNPAAEQATKAIKDANNVLVTVKNNPSVDELSAAIALTLMLKHLNKHAITVFSGRVPSTIEFLQPEMAIDTNTDSLRDFIIALDKSKADKLRYKVEDNVVRIFITPYKTSITERDLEFSQGDFNVDVVVALGVVTKEDFDQAVTAHGRILHDATVVTLTKKDMLSQLGAVNWQEHAASSISEMITSIVDGLGENLLDGQIATALLTGIVSETDRFRNENTTPQVMSLSSRLMAAGANQQLIAEKLEEPDMGPEVAPLSVSENNDGALEIAHDDEEAVSNIHIDDSGNLQLPAEPEYPQSEEAAEEGIVDSNFDSNRSYIKAPTEPILFGQDDSGSTSAQPLLATEENKKNEPDEYRFAPSQVAEPRLRKIEPLPAEEPEDSVPATPVNEDTQPANPVFTQMTPPVQPVEVSPPEEPSPVSEVEAPQQPEQTLEDIEKAVASSHALAEEDKTATEPSVDDFLGTTRAMPTPTEEKQEEASAPALPTEPTPEEKPEEKKEEPPKTTEPVSQPAPQVFNPNTPPAVPPPLMPQANSQPQFFEADGTNSNPFLNPKQ